MSWEAYGSGDDHVDPEVLYRRGWESDDDCDRWWRKGEPETTYTFAEVCEMEMTRDDS